MGAYNDDPNFKKTAFYKLVADDDNKIAPLFVERIKQGNEYVDGQSFKYLQGNLVDIRVEKFKDKKGVDREALKFIFDDDKDENKQLVISTYFTMISRSMLNALASEDSIGLVNFSGYFKGDYGKVGVKVNGKRENSSWKYTLDEIPKPLETTFKGQVMRDYTPADDFFKNVINIDIKTKIASPSLVANEMGDKQPSTTNQPQDHIADPDGSDLPF